MARSSYDDIAPLARLYEYRAIALAVGLLARSSVQLANIRLPCDRAPRACDHRRVIRIKVHLRDLDASLVEAWTREFAGVATVTASCGDIFATTNDANRALETAIVSPANSFGLMDGGIDAVYRRRFGDALPRRLQALLAARHHGELPVGVAVIVPTRRPGIGWCISAPTMRLPGSDIADTVNAYLAFRGALRAVLAHNARRRIPIRRVVCPGLGTAIGRMPVAQCARQMRVAWDRVLGPRNRQPRTIYEAVNEDLLG
jgi:O-acetyl-ADP-ribose deacetylase (regulator of RNase III)